MYACMYVSVCLPIYLSTSLPLWPDALTSGIPQLMGSSATQGLMSCRRTYACVPRLEKTREPIARSFGGSFRKIRDLRPVKRSGASLEGHPAQDLSICLSVCLPVCLSIYVSIYLSIYLSIYFDFFLSIYVSFYLSICIYMYLPIDMYVYIYIYIYDYMCT